MQRAETPYPQPCIGRGWASHLEFRLGLWSRLVGVPIKNLYRGIGSRMNIDHRFDHCVFDPYAFERPIVPHLRTPSIQSGRSIG